LLESIDAFPLRIWIVDNSGSMTMQDGHRIVRGVGGRCGMMPCSRWEELGDALEWHARVAAGLGAPTEFRVLNPSGSRGQAVFRFGFGPDEDVAQFRRTLGEPTGRTPLCEQIRSAVARVQEHAPVLRAQGKRCVVVIASDGQATDGNIEEAMRPLRNLPVWLVVRLCTDDDSVVEYWNKVDEELELDMDVLDDLSGEAAEIAGPNPWLAYGAPLHRLREWGSPAKVLDLIDERPLSGSEICKFVALIFGAEADELPNPDIDFTGFEARVKDLNERHAKIWCPIRNREKTWISLGKLRKRYGKAGCVIS
jgi:hypothetical protein